MSYPYRNPQSPSEDSQLSNFSSNPMSPPRNPNRLSGGMMSSNDVRGGLPRRFTTNALPTLSPMAQQRRQAAAGDSTLVSSTSSLHTRSTESSGGGGNGQTVDQVQSKIREMRKDLEYLDKFEAGSQKQLAQGKSSHGRGKSWAGVFGMGSRGFEGDCPNTWRDPVFYSLRDPFGTGSGQLSQQHLLTQGYQPSGGYNRATHVSQLFFF